MTGDATKTSMGAGRILADGTVLAKRYRIIRLLGVGAMGMVYLAHDEQLDLDVALKVLRSGGAANEMRLERFRSELVLARQISHRNVVRIHDIGQSGELYFITMDFVEGESLKHVLDLEGALDAPRATSIAADLAEALAEAHHAGVVHRDVKPGNVLISSERAYLTDFGIARSMHSNDGLTLAGHIVGTLDYLSPEQARGTEVDGRTDIYALGLLLFEMLTGKRPFAGKTAEEALAQRQLAKPSDLTAGKKNIPPTLRRILTRCLAVSPDDRYQDAAELASDLRSGTVSVSWKKPLRRAAIAVLAAAGAFALWSAWPERTADPDTAGIEVSAGKPIAVLPFDVAVSNADLASISHGLAELLDEQLASSAAVQMVASQRVNDTLRDLKLSPARLPVSDQALLGDLLDADYLVVGQLQQIDDSYHIEARLRRAATGEVLHTATFDVQNPAGIFATIAPLATELLANLDVVRDASTVPVQSLDPAVLNDFSIGVDRLSAGNALDAISPLQDAVLKAPDFALAWDRLAAALAMLGRDREALTAAESAVVALKDSGGRSASMVRARKAALAGDLDDATAVLEAMLQAAPGDGEVRFMLAETYGDAGRLQDAESELKHVVAASPDHPQAWYLLGKFSILRGDARTAVDDYLVKALVIQNRLENDQGKADALNALGIAQSELGDEESASDYYTQALTLRKKIGDDRGVAAVLANLARINLRNGRYDEAHDELVAARDALNTIGDRWTVANLENELGFLEEQRGRFEVALEHYREALRLRDDLGDQRALAESYNNIGYTYYLLGQYDNAGVFNERSLDTYRETGNREGIMLASQIRGILETARGRYDDALKALLESLAISREIGDVHTEAVTEGYIGNARHLQGQYSAARASFSNAITKLDELGDTRGRAEFSLHNAALALDTGMFETVQNAIERARDSLADDDNAAGRALLLRIEGQYYENSGDNARALTRFKEALREAELTGEQVAILTARLANAANLAESERLSELQDIVTASRRLGHGKLVFESALALARAYYATKQFADAEQLLSDTRQSMGAAAGFHGAYRLQLLLADTFAALGRTEDSAAALQRAAKAVQQALDAQDEAQQRAFRQLAAVRRVLESQESDDEN
ncbi:MAG: protein kinase [Woeseiaceae bacterium]|nr:protein kinase [Woeseiaceae bacterium]